MTIMVVYICLIFSCTLPVIQLMSNAGKKTKRKTRPSSSCETGAADTNMVIIHKVTRKTIPELDISYRIARRPYSPPS